MTLRHTVKQAIGASMAAVNPQCDYARAIFVIAHMRCGSTALSNILCTRPDVSGYGESHVRHDGRNALGRIVVNQALRGGWRPRARHIFDKILHDRHDRGATPAFYGARGIFVAREPGPAIQSIRNLYAGLDRREYGTDEEAALYYVQRMGTMMYHWTRFHESRRIALTHAQLVEQPEAMLVRISDRLAIRPALQNHYHSPAASQKGGGGDPTASGSFTRIEARSTDPVMAERKLDALDVPPDLARQARAAYDLFLTRAAAA